ncbi:hypothetical protein G4B88_022595 [Cannabis sativa]|uniref:Uncharacterized protein n=1 Tax=Cannabis sativa TaxID=3483 RepID=A0A7J6HW78_CANSA|nr:hypothetical protein G4B88_022595 [Cannabis sativa]
MDPQVNSQSKLLFFVRAVLATSLIFALEIFGVGEKSLREIKPCLHLLELACEFESELGVVHKSSVNALRKAGDHSFCHRHGFRKRLGEYCFSGEVELEFTSVSQNTSHSVPSQAALDSTPTAATSPSDQVLITGLIKNWPQSPRARDRFEPQSSSSSITEAPSHDPMP